MTNLEQYIDLMGKTCGLMKDKADKKELDPLFAQIQILWDKLTEEEQIYADEQTLRTKLWMGI